MKCGPIHYAGCDCHEKQWREKLEKAERERDEASNQRDSLAEALRNLKAEYDDRKNQFGDSPLWTKHEDVDVIKDCHAMIAAVDGGAE